MSLLGTTKHSSCNQTLGIKVVLYCIAIPHWTIGETGMLDPQLNSANNLIRLLEIGLLD